MHQQARIAPRFGILRDIKTRNKLVAIVDAKIGDQHRGATATNYRLQIERILSQQPEQAMAESHVSETSDRLLIWAVKALRRKHMIAETEELARITPN
ncbi:hypothetical protein GCM10011395_05760 [Sphingomonas psychrolutea]|uniref:Uncharacterized protein n=1 Tax=Sphingomonas psychrolutea TaxID=1259676 RepID=A0ABQ1G7X3_9SPHN|nr:hypothetical protein GCM10011395_05760 [Sphingomonas psychrolutea]